MAPAAKNTPSYGRAKEIAVGSQFEFVVLASKEPPKLPSWLRMGLWLSKAKLDVIEVESREKNEFVSEATHPLNPLDLVAQPLSFDLISMPPASLLDHVVLDTTWVVGETKWGKIQLPTELAYRF